MNTKGRFRSLSLWLLLLSVLGAKGQASTNFNPSGEFGSSVKALNELTSITPAYRNEAIRLILAEATQVAEALRLPETLPIEQTNLVASYVTPPGLVQRIGAIGNVTTPNYTYYCSVGAKFSYLSRTGLESEYARLRRECLLPMSQMDTNAAYQLAVKWLSEASMDVKALNRDCKVQVLAFTPQGEKGQHFVPVYWVYWTKGPTGRGSVASVQLFAPGNILWELRVEEPQYILRKPLQVTRINSLDQVPNTTAK